MESDTLQSDSIVKAICWHISGSLLKLAVINLSIEAAFCQEFFVASLFHNVPVPEDQYHICIPDGGQPVCNDKTGAVFGQLIHSPLRNQFRTCIYGGSGFVEDQHGAVLDHGPGDGHELLLTG